MKLRKAGCLLGAVAAVVGIATTGASEEAPRVTFRTEGREVQILVGGQPFATYVTSDDKISRPFFCQVRAPGNVPVTRNYPPVAGKDLTDHATFHPGIWLAFGDLGGADYWRNRAAVKHERFVGKPTEGVGKGSFVVRNLYPSADGKAAVCRETCRHTVAVRPGGYLLLYESEFTSDDADFAFGDQEEMGLGVRVATPLSVKGGGGIVNKDGLRDEAKAWGKQSDWCDYSGVVDGRRVGIALFPDPANFGRSWFHARDYGVLVANPFGRSSFRGGDRSRFVVRKGEPFRLGFGVFVYRAADDKSVDLEAAYRDYRELIGRPAQ